MDSWRTIDRPGTALYCFEANGEHQVSLVEGIPVHVDYEKSGWYRGSVRFSDKLLTGIFPAAYILLNEEYESDCSRSRGPSLEVLSEPPHIQAVVVKNVSSKRSIAKCRLSSPTQPPQELPIVNQKETGKIPQSELSEQRNDETVAERECSPNQEAAEREFSLKEDSVERELSPKQDSAEWEVSPQQEAAEREFSPKQDSHEWELSPKKDSAEREFSPKQDSAERKLSVNQEPPILLPLKKDCPTQPSTPISVDTSENTGPINELSRDRSETFSLVDEIAMAIPGLEQQLKELLSEGKLGEYDKLKERLAQLLTLRRFIMDPETDNSLREKTRLEIISILDSCRRSAEGHICPRTANHAVANVNNTPIQVLIALHRDMHASIQKESSSLWEDKIIARQRQMLSTVSKSRSSLILEDKLFDFEARLPNAHLSLHLDVKACIFSVGEPTEVCFSLFSVQRQQFITEEFVVELTASGMPEDINLLGKLDGEFRELENSLFKEGIYLVCHIFRIGQLRSDGKSQQKKHKLQQAYRRPFGCAVMNISGYTNLFEEFGKWTSPPHLIIYRAKDSLQFAELQNMIIRGLPNIEVVPQAKGLVLGLMLDVMNPKINPLSCVQMLQLSSFINPSCDRNDFYVTLRGGDFLQDKKKSSKNVQILVRVFTAAGYLVPNCIYRGAGPTASGVTEYSSTVFYHTNNPVFFETIKLRISTQIFSQCHLLFTVWHVSSNPEKNHLCSFTFLPLTCSSGAAIADGVHVLPCYKPIKNLGQQNATLRYLDANAHFRSDNLRQNVQSVLIRRKEEIFVETLLSSVKTTQLDSLHALFNWRQLDECQLKSSVAKFTMISGTELAKFVKEVFDTLFSIMEKYSGEECHEKLSALVHLGFLHSVDQLTTKMCSVSGTVDAYIANVFGFTNVHGFLISYSRAAFSYAIQHSASPNPSMFKQLTLLSKCFQYVLKFIVRSAQCANVVNSPSFREQLKGFLDDMTALLKIQGGPKDLLIGCKAFLLRSLSSTFNELNLVFSPSDFGKICLNLLDAVPHHPDNSKLFIYKLRTIGNIAQFVLQNQFSCWPTIEPSVVESLRFHLTNSIDESYLAIGILSDLIRYIQSADPNEHADLSSLKGLLRPLHSVVLLAQKRDRIPSPQVQQMCTVDMLMDSCSALYIILHYMDSTSMSEWIGENIEICPELISACEASLGQPVYPGSWIVLRIWELSIISRLLIAIASHSSQFTFSTIQSLLHCCVVFHRHKDFQDLKENQTSFGDLLSLPEQIRQAMRMVWSNITPCASISQFFCTNLLIPLLNMPAVSMGSELTAPQELAIDMYADLLIEEYNRTDELVDINRFTIDALDVVAHESQEDAHHFLEILGNTLHSRLSSESTCLRNATADFLNHLLALYELMRSLLRIPRTDDFEHERANVVIQLLEFLMLDSNVGRRKGMLYRYYSYLVDLNCSLSAFAEAGNTLSRQLKLLNWSSCPVTMWEASFDSSSAPQETESERKESLYLKVIEYFDLSEQWEDAIQACEHLRQFYEKHAFNYLSLASILEKEAHLFRKIISETRFYPSYFRVVFFAKTETRSEFVYRGQKLESIMDFTERIRSQHADARIVMSSDEPSTEVLTSNKMVITITALSLSSDAESQGMTNFDVESSEIPKKLMNLQLSHHISWFMFCKAENRSTQVQPSNEFKDLWVKKTFIRTEEPFPNVRRRLKVSETIQRTVHPIETACETIRKKSSELDCAIRNLQRNSGTGLADLGPLTMQLNGIIDAAVNGGTKKYIEAFLQSSIEGKEEWQRCLKEHIVAQLEKLRYGLDVFKEMKNSALDPLYNRLKDLFNKMSAFLDGLL